MNLPFPIRQECPPGACICGRDQLLERPGGDIRILRLTREEEKKLVARLDSVATLAELEHMRERMTALLGISVSIRPSVRGVRTVRGFHIDLAEQPGLCRKTRQAIPAAIRRCLDRHPEIAYAILDSYGLLGMELDFEAPPEGEAAGQRDGAGSSGTAPPGSAPDEAA